MTGRFFRYWLPVLLWMVIIFAASADKGSRQRSESIVRPPVQFIKPNITEPQLKRIDFDARKAAHFFEYAVLAFLLWRALRSEPRTARWRGANQLLIVLLVCALYATTDEWHQGHVKTRTPSVRDVLIDTSGAAFGALVFFWVSRWRNKKAMRT